MTWHVMMQPHDWARIYLRHRFTEYSPNHAIELSSYTVEEYEVRAAARKLVTVCYSVLENRGPYYNPLHAQA